MVKNSNIDCEKTAMLKRIREYTLIDFSLRFKGINAAVNQWAFAGCREVDHVRHAPVHRMTAR
jgi:hypothetical protein